MTNATPVQKPNSKNSGAASGKKTPKKKQNEDSARNTTMKNSATPKVALDATKSPAPAASSRSGKKKKNKTESAKLEPAETQSYVPFEIKYGFVLFPILVVVVASACWIAYDIRLHSIRTYGRLIHEFDPWFNYRATEYLHANGLRKFLTWYDHQSWWPLGRPVGSTIYPGMQITSVAIKNALDFLNMPMSLNDVCCFVPAWFGVIASLFTGLLAYEVSSSYTAGALACFIMSCIPAHTMRSMGGGYDNESIAMTAMTAVFYFWCRSLRNKNSAIFFGIITGLAYVNMVAAWGGYIFVLNMVGIHAFLQALRMDSLDVLWPAYSLFYLIGTAGAVSIPVVGAAPLRSLEQLGPMGVFFLLNLLKLSSYLIAKWNIKDKKAQLKLHGKVFAVAGTVAVFVALMLYPTGYFGPLSARVRGMFLKHTRTGNPLVDSVAEHQPASVTAYAQFLEFGRFAAPVGFLIKLVGIERKSKPALLFGFVYAWVATYFSNKMVRLIILLAPVCSIWTGIALAALLEWAVAETSSWVFETFANISPVENLYSSILGLKITKMVSESPFAPKTKITRTLLASVSLFLLYGKMYNFYLYGNEIASHMGNPSIVFYAQTRDGRRVLVDDYLKSYEWLRDNTPEDARVMAWWDYGYQITGIGNRTTIADGNTWNHEHIATLGRCLVSPEKKAHKMIRHLADYVLIWTGGGGDDLAKMPHMARIANSIYSDVCKGDPLCSQLGYLDQAGTPSPFMANSLIYKLHSYGIRPDASVDSSLFELVHTSKYGKVRIYKVLNVDEESKRWNSDPENYVCDPPGSWICKGSYPPKFRKFIKNGKNFAQLGDFNVELDDEHSEYQKKYHASMKS